VKVVEATEGLVELGEHIHTHIVPRLKKVIDGEDPGGITKAVDWKGGGGFRYYRLAPLLLEKDKWGNWVINKAYNSAMLAEALCKLFLADTLRSYGAGQPFYFCGL
jgi:adenine-specific DNA-methyltransferase